MNVSASTADPFAAVSARVNSSVQPLEVVGLAEDRVTTLALTFVQSAFPTVLGIDAIVVTVSDNKCVRPSFCAVSLRSSLPFPSLATSSCSTSLVPVFPVSTAPFVSPSLPASTSLPAVTPSVVAPASSTAQPSAHEHGQTAGDVAAEVLGAVLGAALVGAGASLVLVFFRRRRRRASVRFVA